MEQILSFLKTIATSNTFNFLLMLIILALIIKKASLNRIFKEGSSAIEITIKNSDNTKKEAKKNLKDAKALIDKLPEDIKNLEKNSKEKINVFKNKIKENTQNTIVNITSNIDKTISIEGKKISSIITDNTVKDSIDMAKQKITDMLEQNPELHNKFIDNSIEELEKVKL